jgi:tetratricopeptide (TPR) repeat protein
MKTKLVIGALAAIVVAGCTNSDLVGGRNYVKDGTYDKAVTVLEKAVEKSPENAEAHFLLGKSYAETGVYDKAATSLNRASELDSGFYAQRADTVRIDMFAKLFNAGNELLNAGQYQEALDRYLKAAQFQPQKVAVHQNLGFVYTKLGRRDEAIAEYMKMYELDPANVNALKTVLGMLTEAGEREQAYAICKRIIAAKPKDVEASAMLAEMYMDDANAAKDKGDVEGQKRAIAEALPLYENILAADATSVTARYQVGVCHYTLQEFGNAAENFEKVVEGTDAKNPLHVDALSNLSASYYKMDQFGAAETHLRELIALEPDDCTHYRLLSAALREQGRTNEALDAAKMSEECDKKKR